MPRLGPGAPLDAATRAFFEPRFGWDFSAVRIHADDRGAASARALGARAYTVGRNVVFAPGTYAPRTAGGDALLAHELAHVTQQNAGPPRLQRSPADGPREELAEGARAPAAIDRALTSPVTDSLMGGFMGRGQWALTREVFLGWFAELEAQPPERRERILQRYQELLSPTGSWGDKWDFYRGYLIGLAKGIVSPITDVIELVRLGAELQMAALRWLIREGPRLFERFDRFSGRGRALLSELEALWPTAWDELTTFLRDPSRAMGTVAKFLDRLAAGALHLANQAGRRVARTALEALELPWRELGEKVGYACGVVLIEVLLAVATNFIGNLVTRAVAVAARAARLAVEGIVVVIRELGTIVRGAISLLRKLGSSVLSALERTLGGLRRVLDQVLGLLDELAAAVGPRVAAAPAGGGRVPAQEAREVVGRGGPRVESRAVTRTARPSHVTMPATGPSEALSRTRRVPEEPLPRRVRDINAIEGMQEFLTKLERRGLDLNQLGYDTVAKQRQLLDRLEQNPAEGIVELRGALDRTTARLEREGAVQTRERLEEGAREFGERGPVVREAHDLGVTQGRRRAIQDGLTPSGWENPLGHRGGFGQGFDDIMFDAGDNPVVIEYKGGGAEVRTGQMTRAWVEKQIAKLEAPPPAGDPTMAARLRAALEQGRLRGRVYRTPLDANGRPLPTMGDPPIRF